MSPSLVSTRGWKSVAKVWLLLPDRRTPKPVSPNRTSALYHSTLHKHKRCSPSTQNRSDVMFVQIELERSHVRPTAERCATLKHVPGPTASAQRFVVATRTRRRKPAHILKPSRLTVGRSQTRTLSAWTAYRNVDRVYASPFFIAEGPPSSRRQQGHEAPVRWLSA